MLQAAAKVQQKDSVEALASLATVVLQFSEQHSSWLTQFNAPVQKCGIRAEALALASATSLGEQPQAICAKASKKDSRFLASWALQHTT